MRIVGGKYKGRRIVVHKNFKARPTTDFAKESLFNILSNYFNFETCTALDLFSGTGSIGFEFASRGSKKVCMVEKDYRNANFILKVVEELAIGQVQVITEDAFRYIKHANERYSIVFADPPYTLQDIETLPEVIRQSQIVKPAGWFILEHSKDYNFSNTPHFKELRKYGSVHFSIFEY